MRFSKRTRGFSLFELLIVLGLTAILIALASLSWRSMFTAGESQAVLMQLQEALRFARQEAMVLREKVALCGSHDQETCAENWRRGILVMSSDKEILHVFQWGNLQGVLHWRAFPRSQSRIEFLPSGATNYENGTFWYCPPDARYPAWSVVLAQSGHWQVLHPNSDGYNYQHSFNLPYPVTRFTPSEFNTKLPQRTSCLA